jgi:methylated-DNA-[protein]-cysteine S-methyltransferase
MTTQQPRVRSNESSTEMFTTTMPSPVGDLLLVSDGTSLTGLFMAGEKNIAGMPSDLVVDDTVPVFAETKHQLAEYFAGNRNDFDVPLSSAGTEFQRTVWAELQRIPFGVTISYGELAKRIDNPAAVRAVGLANGKNPISIIVPCHRVIGANGSLTGYGGGLPAKEWLLRHEGALL